MSAWADHIPGWFRKSSAQGEETPSDDNAITGSMSTTGGGLENEPVVVWEAANLMEAQVVKGRLESEGIPALIRGEALATIYGLTAGNLAAAKVLVPAPLADKAIAILSDEEEVERKDELEP
ncbi:DUF2007 domain-containing protein [Caldilinea sp.]|uniref:putative signal transducing protein n=1 Tax=Caldilinea sp. TaxID=2293560 RepID=UPI002BF44BC4|nr:DUF2007 domain-containing protein [Anaerolineales bacterium]HQY91526.1 DUF2007 domain-containing protein [Caldilinea sp.]